MSRAHHHSKENSHPLFSDIKRKERGKHAPGLLMMRTRIVIVLLLLLLLFFELLKIWMIAWNQIEQKEHT